MIEQAVADAFLEAITPAADRSHAALGRTTASQPRCGFVAMAFGSGARALRGGAGRAPLSDRGARKPTGRSRTGNRMGESSARSGRRRNGTAPTRAATAQHDQPRATQTHSDARLRYSSGLDCADDHGPRSQGTPAHLAGRSDSESQASRRSRAPDSALARRRLHHAGCSRSASSSRWGRAPTKIRSRCFGAWPLFIPMKSSPES